MKHKKKRAGKVKKPLEPCRSATSTMTNNAVALSISAVMLGGTALAQEAQDEEEAVLLDKVQIQDRTIDTNPYAESGVPYKARVSGDLRRLEELADTPQTMTVLTQTQIEDSGKSDLREILSAQPGITLGTGEGGNAFGDRYIIRGHEARSDVFVDGMRDPGMTIRESFALEQVEITKGPSSTFAGRGSTGGAINGITKQASSEYDFVKFQGGLGTDEYYRVHLDANKRFTDELAVRANLLYANEEVPDRAPAERLRRGAAVSGRYDPTDNKFYLSFDYYFLDAEDDPDLGTQIEQFGNPFDDIPVYLQKDRDFLKSEVHTFTFRGGYEFNDNFRLESVTRYGFTDNGYVLTGTSAFWKLTGTDQVAWRLSQKDGWQEVDYVATQLNAFLDTGLSFTQHGLLLGVEYSEHNVLNGRYNVDPRGTPNCDVEGVWRGTLYSRPGSYCMYDNSGNLTANLNSFMDLAISRGDNGASQRVGHQQQGRTQQSGGRNQQAVVRPDGEADHMRYDQAHEADDPARCYRSADRKGDTDGHVAFQLFTIDTEIARFILAEQQDIQFLGIPNQQQRCRQDERGGHTECGPEGRAEATHGPERQGAQLGIVAQIGQEAGSGSAQRVDGNTGQQHIGDGKGFHLSGQPKNQQTGQQPADKGGDTQPVQAQRTRQRSGPDDHDRNGQGRAAGNADQAGVGQRVAEQALQGRTGNGQGRADNAGQQHTRQPDGEEDGFLLRIQAAVEQRNDRHGHRTDACSRKGSQDEYPAQQHQHDRPKPQEGQYHWFRCPAHKP